MDENKDLNINVIDNQLLTDFTQLMVDNLTGIKLVLKTQSKILSKLENINEEDLWRDLNQQWKKESELLLPEYLPDFLRNPE